MSALIMGLKRGKTNHGVEPHSIDFISRRKSVASA